MCGPRPGRASKRPPVSPTRSRAGIRQTIPPAELDNILDNIGLPYSNINYIYNRSGLTGAADADVLVSLKEKHHPTADYVRTLRQKLPREFPGTTFYFIPADIVTQILNFGLPAPIDIQIDGPDIVGNRRVADKMLYPTKPCPRHCGSAHSAAIRLSQVSCRRRSHQGGAGRLYGTRHCQQLVDLSERQLPGDAHVLSQSEERRLLQSGHANAAIRHSVAPGSAKYSDQRARTRSGPAFSPMLLPFNGPVNWPRSTTTTSAGWSISMLQYRIGILARLAAM